MSHDFERVIEAARTVECAECTDLSECVRRAREGDEEAARELFRGLYPMVLRLVRSNLPRRTDEEDLVQTVFMKVFSKLEQYSGTVPLEHWVSRIAVNTCLSQIGRERVRPELRLADLSEEEEEAVTALAMTSSELPASHIVASSELIGKLMAFLVPADRLVVTLLHLEGRSVAEVSELTGWNRAVVKIRAFRARLKLRKHLNELLSEATE